MQDLSHKKSKMHPTKNTTQENFGSLLSSKLLGDHYSPWSSWSKCNRRCEQSRKRTCMNIHVCGDTIVKDRQKCVRRIGKCHSLSYKVIGRRRKNRLIEELLYDLLYDTWSQWGRCTRACKRRRNRRCKEADICGSSYIQEEKKCKPRRATCRKTTLVPFFQREKGRIRTPKNKNTHPSPHRGIYAYILSSVLLSTCIKDIRQVPVFRTSSLIRHTQ